MKRFSSSLFIILILISFFGGALLAPQTALAEAKPGDTVGKCYFPANPNSPTPDMTQADCTKGGGTKWEQTGVYQGPSTPDGKAIAAQDSATQSCGLGNIFSIACLSDFVFWIPGYVASYIVMPLMSLLVYLSGMILNWSMEYSVVHMKLHFDETNIGYLWSVIRDLANMGFIFALLYAAIQAVIGKGELQRTLRNLVIAALLINFSMLITQAIVDASNVLAMLFYNAIAPGGTTTTTGIGAAFMNVLNLQSFYNLQSVSGIAGGTKMAIVGVLGSIVYLIASFTFLAVAVMFIIRFVALVFVIALSPIYAIGKVLPNTSGYADQWEKALLNQSFFAPAYFALTWLALKVSEGLLAGFTKPDPVTGVKGTLNYSAAILGNIQGTNGVKADPSAVGVFMLFAIIIGLLLAALSIAKGMAEKSHPMMKDLTGRVTAFAGGATLGLGARFLQTTAGRAGSYIQDSEKLKDAVAKGGMSGRLARLTLSAGDKATKSSFDLRGTGIGKSLGAGKTPKGFNFADRLKQTKKDEEEFVKRFKPAESDRASYEEGEAKDTLKNLTGYKDDKKLKADFIDSDEGLATRARELGDVRRKAADASLSSTEQAAAKKRSEELIKEIAAINDFRRTSKRSKELKDIEKKRKETYATNLETPNSVKIGKFNIPLPDSNRTLFFGELGREHEEAALAIRKGMKEKSKDKKLADAIKEATKDEDVTEETPKATTPLDAGTPPASGTPTTT